MCEWNRFKNYEKGKLTAQPVSVDSTHRDSGSQASLNFGKEKLDDKTLEVELGKAPQVDVVTDLESGKADREFSGIFDDGNSPPLRKVPFSP